MTESKLEKSCKRFVENEGGLFIKQPSAFYKGIPDRLIITKEGRIFFVELKIGNNSLSPLQEYWFKKLKKRNVLVFEIRTLNEFIKIYKEVENGNTII